MVFAAGGGGTEFEVMPPVRRYILRDRETVDGAEFTSRGVHPVQRPLLSLVENVSQKHDVAPARTHSLDATELDVELVQRPVRRPAMTEMHQRP